MAYPPPWEHKLAERNLGAMWGNYRALGYRRMIYTNTVCALPDVIEQLTDAMGDDPKIVAILLTCTDSTARKRLCQCETGSTLDQHRESSVKMADLLQSNAPGWVHRVPTGLSEQRWIRSWSDTPSVSLAGRTDDVRNTRSRGDGGAHAHPPARWVSRNDGAPIECRTWPWWDRIPRASRGYHVWA